MKWLLLLAAFAPIAEGSVLVSQAQPNGNSFDITDYRLADDFTASVSGTVESVRFWYQAQQQTDLATVSYAVYQDSSGAPATVLQSGTAGDPSTSFDNASGFYVADFAIAPLPVLASTTYCLELHAGSSLTDTSGLTVSWAAVDDNAADGALESLSLGTPDSPVAVSGFNQYAFELSGTAAPEPSEWVVLTAAALVAAYLKLRKRKAAANR